MATTPSLAQLVRARIDAWNQQHPDQQIDPSAALSVSAQEGLGGGIGDGGHAFGPFQLNNAGGVITGKFPGQSPEQIQSWASSPDGIDYALGGIGKVAGGLQGPAAVNAIVSRFERPADPQGEISRALGNPQPTVAGSPHPSVTAAPQPASATVPLAAALSRQAPTQDVRGQFLQSLLGAQQNGQLDQGALLQALIQRRQAMAT